MKKNFKRKLSLVCSKQTNQQPFQYLFFRNSFVYVTNGHILLRHSLKAHGFEAEEIALLDDVCMHREVFDVVYGYESINITKEGNQVYVVGTKGKVTAKYGIQSAKAEEVIEPKFESLLPQGKFELGVKNHFGVNVDLMVILKSTMIGEHYEGSLVHFFFQDDLVKNDKVTLRPIIIKSFATKAEDELIIIMPCVSVQPSVFDDTDIDWGVPEIELTLSDVEVEPCDADEFEMLQSLQPSEDEVNPYSKEYLDD